MAAPYDFAGEEFLSVDLPNYETDRIALVAKLVTAFVAWLVILPLLLASPATPSDVTQNGGEGSTGSSTVATKNHHGSKKRTTITAKKIVHKKGKKERKIKSEQAFKVSEPTIDFQEGPAAEVSEVANILCIIAFLVNFCYLIVVASPDNRYTTRGVFEAPLFTREECGFIVDMAETVARRNHEAALEDGSNSTLNKDLMLKEPVGWQKKRHQVHSTTDLNVITDPFSKEDRQWIKEKLDARLAPTIERLYGVNQGSIRANDIFVIRYDGDRQASLNPHTDDGDVSFSALLSDGFTGGGTNYYDRENHYYHESTKPYNPQPDEVFAHVLPEIGQMTLFRGPILHEGVQVTKGRRYLLIGFLSVDNVDPWTSRSTGLSWFASWLSLNWAAVRFGTGYSAAVHTNAKQHQEQDDWMAPENNGDWMSESSYIRGLFIQAHILLTTLADLSSKHFFQQIIPAQRTKQFLRAMDEAYKRKRPKNPPSWFSGQQVELGITGSFHSEWSTRTRNSEKFDRQVI